MNQLTVQYHSVLIYRIIKNNYLFKNYINNTNIIIYIIFKELYKK